MLPGQNIVSEQSSRDLFSNRPATHHYTNKVIARQLTRHSNNRPLRSKLPIAGIAETREDVANAAELPVHCGKMNVELWVGPE